jgi:TonB-linked SusC/RagA family outer membrane protein
MKTLILGLFIFLAGNFHVYGVPQEKTVTGTVIDAITGEPLPEVHVLVEGTQIGVSTDLDGKFVLVKPSDGAIISFSFIGYKTERITYSGQPVVDVKLFQSIEEISEVVVIGYGTQKKSDLTGSVSGVKAKDIVATNPVNIEQALQGRVPGLVMVSNSGDPGSEGSITIRGLGSINNNDPIYVIDGMIIDISDKDNAAKSLKYLNPTDIASIEVLKDASAQAIYGARGANGVILITTKKGSEGAPTITFSSTMSYESLIRINRLMDATEFEDWVVTSNYNDYIRTTFNPDPGVDPDTLPASRDVVARYNTGVNTDWLEEILRDDRISQNYDFSISGGTKEFHYAASAGYLDKKGLIKLSEYKRYSFRLNTDYKIKNFLTMGENLGITNTRQTGDYGWTQIMRDALWGDPIYPVLKSDTITDPSNPFYINPLSPYYLDTSDPDYKINKYAPLGGGPNPVAEIILQNYPQLWFTLVGNVFAEAEILKELKLRTSWGFNLGFYDRTHFNPTYNISTDARNVVNSLNEENQWSNNWVSENTLIWNKKLEKHSVSAMIGFTSEYTKVNTNFLSKENIPSNLPEMQTFSAATTQPVINGDYYTYSMMSFLGRINYSFEDKYLLTTSLRYDGSSKFGPGHKWGTFPSFSLGWKINRESFFKNITNDFFSELKLRTGWGEIGNSSLPVSNGYVSQLASVTSGYDFRYPFGNNIAEGYWFRGVGTPDITWETTQQTNIGLDIGFLKNAVTLTLDYYIKKTDNILLQLPIVQYAGYSSNPYINAGSIQNKGFEFQVNYQGKTGKFTYGISANGATFKNKVTSLGPENTPITYGASKTEVGSSMGRFYGYLTNGVFQNEYDVQSYKSVTGEVVQPYAHAGDFRFMDLNQDGKIDDNDKTWIGSPWPKLTYGLTLNAGYGGFDLVVFYQGSYGNDIADFGRWYGNTLHGPPNEYYYKKAWRGLFTSNTDPLFTTVDDNGSYYRISNYYIEDGSYVRLKNLQLGYNLPKAICEKLKLANLRIWIGGTNLLTLTKYHENDPEIGATSSPSLDPGWDWAGFYPKPMEVSMGLVLTF